ncbi:MAG: methionine adenosyltransferase [Phycisphaerae bacterium]|nr:methionine adenosyltransferase [Phycisphaerae bacterium]
MKTASTYMFTSESVSMGHPDKLADQISDAVLDALLTEDPKSRVACETLVTTGLAVIAGEVTTGAKVNIPDIVRAAVKKAGYDDGQKGFDYKSCSVMVALGRQSQDIKVGVDEVVKDAKKNGKLTKATKEQGAGDQGMMFGFACNETAEYMPLPISLSHALVKRQAEVREKGVIKGLRPDAKSQVTVEYDGLKPMRVDTVVLSTQHDPAWNGPAQQAKLKAAVIQHVIKPALGKWWNDKIKVHVNPTGQFEIGGPHGDCGLTGRKIIVDTYGGRGRHGGGAFSGKDPSKVDRSAAYMGRYIAKNIVAAGLADVCEVQLSYAIGVAEPTSVFIDTQGTSKVCEQWLAQEVRRQFQLTPRGINESLGLLKPINSATATHGHFGRKPDEAGKGTFTWEKTDKADALARAARSAPRVEAKPVKAPEAKSQPAAKVKVKLKASAPVRQTVR